MFSDEDGDRCVITDHKWREMGWNGEKLTKNNMNAKEKS